MWRNAYIEVKIMPVNIVHVRGHARILKFPPEAKEDLSCQTGAQTAGQDSQAPGDSLLSFSWPNLSSAWTSIRPPLTAILSHSPPNILENFLCSKTNKFHSVNADFSF